MDIEMARRIDEVCRRFEAQWRQGRQPRIEDFLCAVAEEGRAALASELEALQRELCEQEVNRQNPAAEAGTPRSTIAEAQTIPPGSALTPRPSGEACSSVHDDATLAPREEATIDLGASASARTWPAAPTHIRYFSDYEISRELARAGMGVVFRVKVWDARPLDAAPAKPNPTSL